MKYMTIGLAGLLFLSLSSSAIADDAEKTLKLFGAFVVGGEWEFKSAAGENVALKYSWFGKEKFLRLSGTRDGKATDKIVVIGVDPKSKKVTIWDFSVQGVIVPTMTQKEDGIWNVEAAFTGKLYVKSFRDIKLLTNLESSWAHAVVEKHSLDLTLLKANNKLKEVDTEYLILSIDIDEAVYDLESRGVSVNISGKP